MFLKIFRLPHR